MTTRVIDFIRANALLSPGDKVLCAVSGGADSMAMLHILMDMRYELGISLYCAHYNHGIRGAEAARDEEFVRASCKALDIPFEAGRGDVPAYAAENGLGMEEAARILRYAFLEDCAQKLGCSRIATAHNAMDNAETMLMNLLRGTGLRGMGGIAPKRGKIIRPILCLDRPEIEQYLSLKNIDHITDSTNLSDDYSRNRLRHNVMAPLREINPDFAVKFLYAAASMRRDEEYLASLAEAFLAGQGDSVSAGELSSLPPGVAARAVMRLAPSAQSSHVRAVLELAKSPKAHGEVHLPGMRVLRQYDRLFFGAAGEEALPEVALTPGSTVRWGKYTIRCLPGGGKRTKHIFSFKKSEICGTISVSPRREGDSIRLCGRGLTKTLKKLFSEAKIPPADRGGVPVIRDERGVLAVYGFGQTETTADPQSEYILQIEIKKCEE